MENINITGIDKAKLLAALYNASKPQGMGFLHFNPAPMTEAEAAELLTQTTYFDYLKGRIMKVELGGNESRSYSHVSNLGEGACARAIAHLLPQETKKL